MDSQDSDLASRSCPFSNCDYTAKTIVLLLSHLRTIHSNDPRFFVRCGIECCSYSAKSFTALYSHIYRRHSSYINRRVKTDVQYPLLRDGVVDSCLELASSPGRVNDDEACTTSREENVIDQDNYTSSTSYLEDIQLDLDELLGQDFEKLKKSSALFILKMKDQHKISQRAVDDIVTHSRTLVDDVLARVKVGVHSKLAAAGICFDEIEGLNDVFSQLRDPFVNIDTCYKQEKYYKENLGLIEAEEIKLYDQTTGDLDGVYHYIPLIPTLQSMLRRGDIRDQVDNSGNRVRTDGTLEDYCDGTVYSTHPLFSVEPTSLQIIAYYDELELCNPLGTHVKQHKLGIVFFILGNIEPKYRSTLKVINLAISARAPLIEKHGINEIMKPFVKDLQFLYNTGFDVTVNNQQYHYKGALVAFLADNLASNLIGGYKLSFSFAYRFCRTCMVPTSDISNHSVDDKCILRDSKTHLEHCALLDGPAGDHYSKTYGINNRSSLLDVPGFSLFEGRLPHDIMHDIYEGVVPVEVKLMLNVFISQGFFDYQYYCDRLMSFPFGYSESDKPVPVTKRVFNNSDRLRLSSSQAMVLIRTLPFIIGEKIPENNENWNCFLVLCCICKIVLSPKLSPYLIENLRQLIEQHHLLFLKLYGNKYFTAKFHNLIHYPRQITQIGPMVRTWTIRYEAKLNFFKQCSRLANFKNITLSLSNRHQRWICFQMSTDDIFSSDVECGPSTCSTLVKEESEEFQTMILQHVYVSQDAIITRPKWIKYLGTTFKLTNAFLIETSDGLDPVFAKISSIIVIGSDLVIFQAFKCRTLYFEDHLMSYIIKVTSDQTIIPLCNLYDPFVYHSYKVNNLECISLRYSFI